MKVKFFLDTLNDTIFDKIESLSKGLNEEREYKNYKDFEDIVYGFSIASIFFYIKPTLKKLPSKFTMGSKI